MPDVNFPKKFLQLLKPRLAEMLATLRPFVTAESPSLEKAAADRCCGVIAAEWNKHGARVERNAQKLHPSHTRISYALFYINTIHLRDPPFTRPALFSIPR